MKRPKFAHKAPDPDAAEPFDSAEEARPTLSLSKGPQAETVRIVTGPRNKFFRFWAEAI